MEAHCRRQTVFCPAPLRLCAESVRIGDAARAGADLQRAAKIAVMLASATPPLPMPRAVLFDLFHTLVSVPAPALAGEVPVSELLGVPAAEWQRRYYEED